MSDKDTMHVDIMGYIAGEDDDGFFIGHGDIPVKLGAARLHAMADLLHTMAWAWEDEAARYISELRCFETPLGDTYFEVIRDEFVEADNREDAEALHLAGSKSGTLSYEALKGLFPDLRLTTDHD